MNWLRYLFFSVISFLIHSVAFSFDAQPTLAYSVTNTQDRALSIQLVAPIPPVEVLKVQEKPVIKKMEEVKKPKVVKKSSVVNESVKVKKSTPQKALPAKKIVAVKQPLKVEKEPLEAVEALPEKATPEKPEFEKALPEKETPKKVVPKVQEKPELTAEVPTEQPRLAETPVKPAQPKMVKKVTFSARPAPISYPHSAKRRNIEGTVLVEVWIDELGKQVKQLIINSSGHEALDNAALAGIAQWQFSRQQADGQAIAHRVQVPINFELN